MNTRFGGRNRPAFVIKRWIANGDGGKALAAPPTVPEVSAAEELNDKIPFE
jgi:hypothetical protein